MNHSLVLCRQRGYVLLISVLLTAVVGTAIAATLPLLGASSAQMGIAAEQSAKARALADACAEYALNELRQSAGYGGSETLILGQGSCTVLSVLGNGNQNRTVQTTGTVGNATRRVEVVVANINPQLTLDSWQEVWEF